MSRVNKIVFVVMLAIGCGIFAYESRSLNFNQLVGDVSRLKWGWLLVALACMLISWGFEAVVLRVFLKGRTEQFNVHNAVRIPLIEQLFNAITPFSTGGQPAQLVALMQSKVEAGQASSVLLMKFIVYQFMVLVNFLLSMIVGFSQVSKHFGTLSILISFGLIIHVVVLVALLLIMYYNRFTKQLVRLLLIPVGWFVSQKRVATWHALLLVKIDTFYAESLHLKREPVKLLKGCLLTRAIGILLQCAIFCIVSARCTKCELLTSYGFTHHDCHDCLVISNSRWFGRCGIQFQDLICHFFTQFQ